MHYLRKEKADKLVRRYLKSNPGYLGLGLDEKTFGMLRKTRVFCSEVCCGQQRKYSGPTMQELRQLDPEIEECLIVQEEI